MNEKSKKLMADYNDRGMIKWQPFAALEGHGSYVTSEAIKRLKIRKPILSPDQKDLLDEKLILYNKSNKEAMIKYYKDGFIEIEIGRINDINKLKKEITINNLIIIIDDIVELI
ncbi:YolD-like family protein [Mycoplasmatota bacterium WC44]